MSTTTYLSHVVTDYDIVRFYPNSDDAFACANEQHATPPVTFRYFHLDDGIPEPSNAIIASFDDIEDHIEKENYKTAIGNFH